MKDDRSRFVNAMRFLRRHNADSEVARLEDVFSKDFGAALCILFWLHAPNISTTCASGVSPENLEINYSQWWQTVLELSQLMRPAQMYQKLTHVSIGDFWIEIGSVANVLQLPAHRPLEILGLFET